MAQPHPFPVLARNERTEAAAVDRTLRHEHPVAGRNLPEPGMETMRGPKLVALWTVLIALSWGVVIGLGYGLWRLAGALF
jgi:hypothetical protein